MHKPTQIARQINNSGAACGNMATRITAALQPTSVPMTRKNAFSSTMPLPGNATMNTVVIAVAGVLFG